MHRYHGDRTLRYRRALCVTAALLLIGGTHLQAQQNTASQPDSSGCPDTARLLDDRDPGYLMPAAILRRESPPISGRILGIDCDSLYVHAHEGPVSVAFSDMTRLMTPGHRAAGSAATYALVFGCYASMLLVYTEADRPGLYPNVSTRDMGGFSLATLGLGSLASCIVYLFARAGDTDEESYFVPRPSNSSPARSMYTPAELRRMEEERLRNDLVGSRNPRTVHLTVQLSEVHPSNANRALQFIHAAGISPYHYYDQYSWSHRAPLNLLRKAQVRFAVANGISVGAAYMGLSEPVSFSSATGQSAGFSHDIDVNTKANGLYAVAAIEPAHGFVADPFELLLGAGLGLATPSGSVSFKSHGGTYPNTIQRSGKTDLGSTLLSAQMFGELRAYLYSSLSLALCGEYVHVAKCPVDPVAEYIPNGTTIDFSSWSWGIALGLHF